jgi:Cu2+-exporting ATPase
MAHVDVLLLDKTGTLTRGKPEIRNVAVEDGWSADEALARAAGLEAASGHPLAEAFAGRQVCAATGPETVAGAGVEGWIDGVRHRIGRPDWVAELLPDVARPGSGPPLGREAGTDTEVSLASAEGPIARFEIGDALRPGVVTTLDALRDEGIRLEIVSGDAAGPVAAVAEATGIEAWRAGLDPAGKLARLETLRGEGHRVAMLGDGVNDAPVLAGADVSLAMGSGTSLAQTSADLILLGHSLAPIATGHRVARRTLRVIRQNLAWAAGYNALAMPAAALGWVQPWMAAIGMSLSSLVVVLNAARLGRLPGTGIRRPERPGQTLAEAGS